MGSPESGYVLGHADHERRRLALQASLINPLTDAFLRRAGISGGMHVLELGCGIGEVSLIVARLVGPQGHVHSLDIDPAALDVARGRVHSAGHDQVTFEQIEVMQHAPAKPYDAVIGRHILLHTPDAQAVLRKAVEIVHGGGFVAFQEPDLSFYPRGYPELPLMFSTQDLMIDFWRAPCLDRTSDATFLAHAGGWLAPARVPPRMCDGRRTVQSCLRMDSRNRAQPPTAHGGFWYDDRCSVRLRHSGRSIAARSIANTWRGDQFPVDWSLCTQTTQRLGSYASSVVRRIRAHKTCISSFA